MTPPEYLEKFAQFVPNWNSIGMPVTTPTAKFRPKIFAQNRDRGGVALITGPERAPFPVDEEPGESHRQLRKEIVVGDGEGELKPVPEGRVVHHEFAAPAIANADALASSSKRETR